MTDFPKIWGFDENRRVYPPGVGSSPIWRAHWRELEVIGETSRSWVTSDGRRIPKKGGHGIVFSQAEIDRLAWVHDNRHKLAEIVQALDFERLRAVANLLCYEPKAPTCCASPSTTSSAPRSRSAGSS